MDVKARLPVTVLSGFLGAGKTTVFQLLLRFYDPEQGRVLLDGQDLRELARGDFRRSVALVPQDPVIFAASARDNILDEATSALDAESERLVQQAVETVAKGRTTIVIAHRLATVKQADRIVVMDEGRIVAQGRHEDLVAQEGLYARLARLQFT